MKNIAILTIFSAVLAASAPAFAGEVNSRTFNEFSRGTRGEWGTTVTKVDSQISSNEHYKFDASSLGLKIETGHVKGLDVFIKNRSDFAENGGGRRSELTTVKQLDTVRYDAYTRTYGIEAESGAGN